MSRAALHTKLEIIDSYFAHEDEVEWSWQFKSIIKDEILDILDRASTRWGDVGEQSDYNDEHCPSNAHARAVVSRVTNYLISRIWRAL